MPKFGCIERPLSRFFDYYGQFVARNPLPFIVFPLLLTAFCSLGFLQLDSISDAIYLFTPVNAPSKMEKQAIHDLWPLTNGSYIPGRAVTQSREVQLTVRTRSDENILENYPTDISYTSGLWEKAYQKALEEYPEDPYIKYTYFHSQSLAEELKRNADSLIPRFIVAFTILVIFSVICSMALIDGTFYIDWTLSKPVLAVLGVLNAGMGIATAIGALNLASLPYNDIVLVMPFLVAVGTDNMFLMVATVRRTNRAYPSDIRIGECLSDAAISVFTTSLTDAFIFGVGAITDIPAVQIFCFYTCAAITFTFLYQITFFVGWLAVALKWESEGRHYIFLETTVPDDYFSSSYSVPEEDKQQDWTLSRHRTKSIDEMIELGFSRKLETGDKHKDRLLDDCVLFQFAANAGHYGSGFAVRKHEEWPDLYKACDIKKHCLKKGTSKDADDDGAEISESNDDDVIDEADDDESAEAAISLKKRTEAKEEEEKRQAGSSQIEIQSTLQERPTTILKILIILLLVIVSVEASPPDTSPTIDKDSSTFSFLLFVGLQLYAYLAVHAFTIFGFTMPFRDLIKLNMLFHDMYLFYFSFYVYRAIVSGGFEDYVVLIAVVLGIVYTFFYLVGIYKLSGNPLSNRVIYFSICAGVSFAIKFGTILRTSKLNFKIVFPFIFGNIFASALFLYEKFFVIYQSWQNFAQLHL